MSVLKVKTCRKFDGDIRVPGDKSISHRAVIFGSLAEGTTHVTGFLPGEDCLCTMRAFQAMGVHIDVVDETTLTIQGCGRKLQAAREPIDCGNSGTAMRLLAGVLAGQPFASSLFGDASLSSRPMKRVMDPLVQMGAKVTARGAKNTPPLEIEGGPLAAIKYRSPVASAQVKSCVLLAGLFAKGTTTVVEPVKSRDHTERMLEHFYAHPVLDGLKVGIHGGTVLHANDLQVPGDISSAAFWIVAAASSPDASLVVRDVGLNPTRTGLLSVLLRMGAQIREKIDAKTAEPYGTLQVQGRRLKGTVIGGGEIPNVIDELPILAVAAALAEGETIIKDAAELRVKETDRIQAMAGNLRAFGVPVEETEDGMVIQGGAPLHAAEVESYGDHRIAMACAVLGLFVPGITEIHDTDCIATSYPTFTRDLEVLTQGAGRRAVLWGGN
jgi:3-phosphoshikimate 1-carboxyvinyltransferase